jgi:hypothetical protein
MVHPEVGVWFKQSSGLLNHLPHHDRQEDIVGQDLHPHGDCIRQGRGACSHCSRHTPENLAEARFTGGISSNHPNGIRAGLNVGPGGSQVQAAGAIAVVGQRGEIETATQGQRERVPIRIGCRDGDIHDLPDHQLDIVQSGQARRLVIRGGLAR